MVSEHQLPRALINSMGTPAWYARDAPPEWRVPCKQLGVETKGRKMNSQGGHKGAIGKNFYKVLLVYPVERLRV